MHYSSKYFGVDSQNGKTFYSRIKHNKKRIYLGRFKSEVEAAIAYDDYAVLNNIECKLNFPKYPENNIPNTKQIQLTRGKFAIVDEDDFEMLSKYDWHTTGGTSGFHAARRSDVVGDSHLQFMHVLLMGKKGIDHKNRNGLHNYKSNLRICTQQQNACNKEGLVNGTSKYKGVYLPSSRTKYCARIKLNKIAYNIGVFTDEIEAAKAYDTKARELFGEFAYLNFPELQTSTNL